MPDFDVVILGAGTAGGLVASEVARAGRAVALVEAGLVGGESPYLASMPSNSLLQSARRGEAWELAVARRDEVIRQLDDAATAEYLADAGVTLLRGTGRIAGPGVVEVSGMARRAGGRTVPDGLAGPGAAVLGYTDLVIATGSEPVAPPVEGITDVPSWTTAEALTCSELPRRLIVLGAGPAGCELAQAFAAFGSQVTLVEAEPRLLPGEAAFAGEFLADALRRTGADVRLGSAVVKAERLDTGLALALADGSMIEADRVLFATGRRPRLSCLGLDALGVTLTPAGALPVDGTCQVITGRAGPGRAASNGGTGTGDRGTDTRRIWAAGDVTGFDAVQHLAAYQAQIVAENILGGLRHADYRAIPRVVCTTPTVYAVGLSPARAAAAGVDLRTASCDLAETPRAAVEDDDRGRVELYADGAREDVLVGATAVGPAAEEWMSEITLAIRAAIPLGLLADVMHAFPSYGLALGRPLRRLASWRAPLPSGAVPRDALPHDALLDDALPHEPLPHEPLPANSLRDAPPPHPPPSHARPPQAQWPDLPPESPEVTAGDTGVPLPRS